MIGTRHLKAFVLALGRPHTLQEQQFGGLAVPLWRNASSRPQRIRTVRFVAPGISVRLRFLELVGRGIAGSLPLLFLQHLVLDLHRIEIQLATISHFSELLQLPSENYTVF